LPRHQGGLPRAVQGTQARRSNFLRFGKFVGNQGSMVGKTVVNKRNHPQMA